ncbi:NAD(P)-binding protein [Massilia eburnea]|uniref:NAD(P)-binding protein n=1 Tax=Massilia eburnea TaxID=1776165 RepID=UPI003D6B9C92
MIIGAGPAGLTAALELIRNSNVRPIVLEASGEVGGISRTVCHNGNRMDLGGHRFFSKSDWVMNWWQDILPIDAAANALARPDLPEQENLGPGGRHCARERRRPSHAGAFAACRASSSCAASLRLPDQDECRHRQQAGAVAPDQGSGDLRLDHDVPRAGRKRTWKIS